MRNLKVDLNKILDLISCADDYGFENNVLFSSFADMIKQLSNDEIATYSLWYLSEEAKKQGYVFEDYLRIRQNVEDFKSKYLVKM